MGRMKKNELINLIESLGIPYDDFYILSSSALVLREILSDAGDLDIAVNQKGFDALSKKYDLVNTHDNWYKVTDNIECILKVFNDKDIEKVGKYNLENLETYYNFIKNSEREKDKLRIPLVEKALK